MNMSEDPENEFRRRDLRGIDHRPVTDPPVVRHRPPSSFACKGGTGPAESRATLGVRHILEGSVRRSGTRVRINAQLIDPDDGDHLWAERYDRS